MAGLIYLGFVLKYPDFEASAYHPVAFGVIAGGAAGLWLLKKLLDLGEGALKLLLELLFLAGVAAYIGWTLPVKSGKPPLRRWLETASPKAAAMIPKR